MPNLYLYGIVKNVYDVDWKELGIDGNAVFTVTEGALSAVVHRLEGEPYLPEDAVKVKECIIAHNDVLSKVMKAFCSVVPLKFGTAILSKNEKSATDNLKEWLKENKEQLEKTWELTKGKREYGIRIYYQKEQLLNEVEKTSELTAIKNDVEKKSVGVAYLLKGKLKSQTAELVEAKVSRFKNDFYELLKGITDNVVVNRSKLAISEKDDLLLNLSILVEEGKIALIRECLEKEANANNGFSYQLVGPFAPYSFVENVN